LVFGFALECDRECLPVCLPRSGGTIQKLDYALAKKAGKERKSFQNYRGKMTAAQADGTFPDAEGECPEILENGMRFRKNGPGYFFVVKGIVPRSTAPDPSTSN
jgi:hypothetical protein